MEIDREHKAPQLTVSFQKIGQNSDGELSFAVIMARFDGKWIFVRHRERSTLEIPGGRREIGETITKTAEREFHEETGAQDFTIVPHCEYTVLSPDGKQTRGLLCYA